MGAHFVDSIVHGHIWSTPELHGLLDEERRLQSWLDILSALAETGGEEPLSRRQGIGNWRVASAGVGQSPGGVPSDTARMIVMASCASKRSCWREKSLPDSASARSSRYRTVFGWTPRRSAARARLQSVAR